MNTHSEITTFLQPYFWVIFVLVAIVFASLIYKKESLFAGKTWEAKVLSIGIPLISFASIYMYYTTPIICVLIVFFVLFFTITYSNIHKKYSEKHS